MRWWLSGVAALTIGQSAAQTPGFIASAPYYPAAFVRQGELGEYFIGNLVRFSNSGQPLSSVPYGSLNDGFDAIPLKAGDYAGCAGNHVDVWRYDGTIKWTKTSSAIELFFRIATVGSDLFVYGRAVGGSYVVQKYSGTGTLIWQATVAGVIGNDILFEGTSDGLFLIAESSPGYRIQRIDPGTGAVTASVYWNSSSTSSHSFAINSGRVGVIQNRSINGVTSVELCAFDGRAFVTGAMPEIWRITAPDPYPTSWIPEGAIAAAPGSGFVFAYVDAKDSATITKQIVGEIDMSGAMRWSTESDGPNEHEMPKYHALFADANFVYATGSIAGRDSSVPYDRFLLSILRRVDGSISGETVQGYHKPDLTGSHLLVDNTGTIAVGLNHHTLAQNLLVLRTYKQAPQARSDRYRLREGSTLLVGVPEGILANDIYAQGATLTITSPPSDGVLTVDQDGGLQYKVDPGFKGVDSARYEVRRDGGATTATINFVAYRYVTSFNLSKTTLQGNDQAVATVNLSSASPSSDVIRVNDNSSLLITPPAAAIPANGQQATFAVSSVPVTVPATRTVSVTYQGETTTRSINLIPS